MRACPKAHNALKGISEASFGHISKLSAGKSSSRSTVVSLAQGVQTAQSPDSRIFSCLPLTYATRHPRFRRAHAILAKERALLEVSRHPRGCGGNPDIHWTPRCSSSHHAPRARPFQQLNLAKRSSPRRCSSSSLPLRWSPTRPRKPERLSFTSEDVLGRSEQRIWRLSEVKSPAAWRVPCYLGLAAHISDGERQLSCCWLSSYISLNLRMEPVGCQPGQHSQDHICCSHSRTRLKA